MASTNLGFSAAAAAQQIPNAAKKTASFRFIGIEARSLILLAQFMTSVTVHCRAPRFVATHTVFHGGGNFLCDDFTLRNRSVATGAINTRFAMPRVAEEHKILDRVDLLGWKRCGLVPQRRQPLDLPAVFLHRAMARHALAHRRERRLLPGLDRRVAILAFDL